jgi:hypothetical protein
MKSILAAAFLVAITGCSSMGMSGSSSSGSTGRSDTEMGKTASKGNNAVIDRSGNLTLHHGG